MSIIILTSLSTNCYAENFNLTGNVTLTQKDSKSDPNQDFLRSITLTLIPIGAGYLVAHFSTNHWQDRKDKINKKQKIVESILKDYDESFKKEGVLLDAFADKIYETYLVYDNPEKNRLKSKSYSRHNLEVDAFIDFPQNIEKQPLAKFGVDYKKLLTNIDACIEIGNHLYSQLRMYYENSQDIITNLDSLADKLIDGSVVLSRLLHCKTDKDLEKYYNIYQNVSSEIIELTKKFESEFLVSNIVIS